MLPVCAERSHGRLASDHLSGLDTERTKAPLRIARGPDAALGFGKAEAAQPLRQRDVDYSAGCGAAETSGPIQANPADLEATRPGRKWIDCLTNSPNRPRVTRGSRSGAALERGALPPLPNTNGRVGAPTDRMLSAI